MREETGREDEGGEREGGMEGGRGKIRSKGAR